jgi:hypothetical protein
VLEVYVPIAIDGRIVALTWACYRWKCRSPTPTAAREDIAELLASDIEALALYLASLQ